MFKRRYPKASVLGNTAAGNIVATTVQAAIDELDTDKVAKAGDTVTGAFILDSTLSGAVINNQYSNLLSSLLLDISSTIKFLNTLTGTPVTDSANMLDVSGNSHDGTYKGTWTAAQRVVKGFGWILDPNGTDNYISIADHNDFSFGDGVNDIAFTIAGVVEVVDTALYDPVVSKYAYITGAELREWVIDVDPTEKIRLTIFDESVDSGCVRVTDAAISVGLHTYTITYSGVGGAAAGNGITIYIDGAIVASTATNNAAYIAMENTTTLCMIGAITNATAVAGFYPGDFTPPVIDKGTVWTAAQVNRFHQIMKGIYNL